MFGWAIAEARGERMPVWWAEVAAQRAMKAYKGLKGRFRWFVRVIRGNRAVPIITSPRRRRGTYPVYTISCFSVVYN
jgi:hypothetical protein